MITLNVLNTLSILVGTLFKTNANRIYRTVYFTINCYLFISGFMIGMNELFAAEFGTRNETYFMKGYMVYVSSLINQIIYHSRIYV